MPVKRNINPNANIFDFSAKFATENWLKSIKIALKIARNPLKLIKTCWNYESLWVIWNKINKYYEVILFYSWVNSGSFMMILGMFSQILWWNLLFSGTSSAEKLNNFMLNEVLHSPVHQQHPVNCEWKTQWKPHKTEKICAYDELYVFINCGIQQMYVGLGRLNEIVLYIARKG